MHCGDLGDRYTHLTQRYAISVSSKIEIVPAHFAIQDSVLSDYFAKK